MESPQNFRPSYVWPNPAFPFRVYYEGPNCRIFIIENIQHNWRWMSEWAGKFRDTDFFFVYCGWYHSLEFAREAETIFSLLGLRKSSFFFLFNSPLELENFAQYGFRGEVINHNAWLDENLVMRSLDVPKRYRAIYVARRSAFKRHHLAAQVSGLALVAGINHGNAVSDVPPHIYLNDRPLTPDEVCLKINESYCGLILSATEGACFSSSEYLLCGVPVVSTKSTGGRDVWYNSYNSIVCEPDPDEVAAAVEHFVAHPPDRERIRCDHIQQAREYRRRFVAALDEIFHEAGASEDAQAYFERTFIHKLRSSYRPNFSQLFGG